MLRNSIPGKFAHFAVMMLFVFIPAQSGAAQTSDGDNELAKTIAIETARARKWSTEGYSEVVPEFEEVNMNGATYTIMRPSWEGMVFVSVFENEARAQDFQSQVLAGNPVLWTDHVNGENVGGYITPAWL